VAEARAAPSVAAVAAVNGMPGSQVHLDARGRIPNNVVYRDFVNETVALNLNTGTYHGLNPTAGRMLQAIERAATLGEAVDHLVSEYGWDRATVEADLLELCRTLADSGLLDIQRGAPG